MENIKWLWGVMDKRYHKWHILGLIISAVTSLMLLINPYLTMRLMDDVIVAQNPRTAPRLAADDADCQGYARRSALPDGCPAGAFLPEHADEPAHAAVHASAVSGHALFSTFTARAT